MIQWMTIPYSMQFFEFEVIAWDYDNSSVIQQTQLRRNSAYEYYYTFWSKGGYLFDVRIEKGTQGRLHGLISVKSENMEVSKNQGFHQLSSRSRS